MRFTITGEWKRNSLLRLIIVSFLLYGAALWVTNALLYFSKMTLSYRSVVEYYLGSEARFLQPRQVAAHHQNAVLVAQRQAQFEVLLEMVAGAGQLAEALVGAAEVAAALAELEIAGAAVEGDGLYRALQ